MQTVGPTNPPDVLAVLPQHAARLRVVKECGTVLHAAAQDAPPERRDNDVDQHLA